MNCKVERKTPDILLAWVIMREESGSTNEGYTGGRNGGHQLTIFRKSLVAVYHHLT